MVQRKVFDKNRKGRGDIGSSIPRGKTEKKRRGGGTSLSEKGLIRKCQYGEEHEKSKKRVGKKEERQEASGGKTTI